MKEKKDTNSQNKSSAKTNYFSLRKIGIILIIVLVGISMVLTLNNINFKTNNNKWIQVGSKSTVGNVIYGEYVSYVEQNYAYIQQNPFMLAQYLNNLISQYITMLLFANEAESLNLTVDNNEVIKTISKISYFQNKDGTFNREEYLKRINQIFGSEEVFLNNITDNMLKQQITESVAPLLQQPYYIGYLDYLALTQTRTIKYIEIPSSLIKNIPSPTKEDLENILKENVETFTEPEKRDASYIVINPNTINNNITVSDNELRNYYKQNKDSYLLKEMRNVSQITFEKEKDAQQAYKKVKSESLDKIKKQYKVIDMGNVDYDSLPEEMSKSIFATTVGSVSTPAKSSIGWHIFIVNSIIEPKPAPFEQVKEDIKTTILMSKENETLDKIKNNVSDMLNNGKTLQEVAKVYNLPYKDLKAFTTSEAKKLNVPSEIANTIFSKDANEQASLLENSTDGTFYAVAINSVHKSKTKTIEESRPQLNKIWNDKKIQEQQTKISADLTSQLLAGKDINKLGYNVKTIVVSFSNNKIPFDPESTTNIFSSKKNVPLQGKLNNSNPFVAIVSNVKNSNIQYVDKNGIRNQEIINFNNYIGQSYTQTLFGAYAENVKKKYKVKVNEKEILDKLAPNKDK